jgi:hypothetical protein
MTTRFKKLGLALMVAGLAFVVVGGYTFIKTQEGATSLKAFSAVQNVTLTYNADGQLMDHGTTEGAVTIMNLLKNDWGYPVVASDLNPNDPVVNTATEYMYQMATVTEHTLTAVVTVHLDKDVVYKGQTFAAGDHEFTNDGRYWTGFDRANPIEGPAREAVWTPTAIALVGELGVGTVTASALQMGLGIAGIAGAMGGILFLFGIGLIWASKVPEDKKALESSKLPAGSKLPEGANLPA